MFIDLSKIQVDETKFTPTKNENTNFEKGTNGCISPEFYSLLIVSKGANILFNGYKYLAIQSGDYVIILREKYDK